ncbi:MAG: SIS domain-containing protein [Clostridia bacterium]|nr:SIS domain-containing protein [Clostridia bacterium]
MLNENLQKHIDLLTERYPVLKSVAGDIEKAYLVLEECYLNDKKLLIAGNGGSCADSEHIVGELMKGFKLSRACSKEFADKLVSIDGVRGAELAARLQGGLPAIALDGHQGLNTAFINDVENGGLLMYAQQINGFGREGDVFLGISTSGNSKNVMYATVVAKAKGLKVIGLTGAKGGELAKTADVAIKVPETETYMIQELHLPVYHCLCLMLEERFFG